MFSIKDFQPRKYQESIKNTCLNYNTLVVLPTGLGKTKVAILTLIERLNSYPKTKAIFLTPTKPLASQIYEEIINSTNIDENLICLLTGKNKPVDRKEIFNNSEVIVATTQTIQKDSENNRISLENVSLLCVDEAHRSREKFANTIVAKNYFKESKHPRLIALTASPGGTKEKIKEICDHLSIEKIEIRTDQSEDVSQYIQKKEIEWITIDLPNELQNIINLIKKDYRKNLEELKKLGISKPISIISKKDILNMQFRFRKEITKGNHVAYYGVSLTSKLIKISYIIELLETQTIDSTIKFMEKLKHDTTKAAKTIIKESWYIHTLEKLKEIKIENPKVNKLSELIKNQIINNENSKVIVFANYRNTIEHLIKTLNKLEKIKAISLIGQKEGLTQKEQISIIKKFEEGTYNCLCCTQIGEEGLDIKGGAELAIFYDSVGSEIRKLQRFGRVGRIKPGKVIFLMNKNTIDVAYYHSSRRKEKTMQNILDKMQNTLKEY
tara:strand:- start:84156 stop:85643 length:1488 start_codon:yes stop_codon:yes gene_type:complete